MVCRRSGPLRLPLPLLLLLPAFVACAPAATDVPVLLQLDTPAGAVKIEPWGANALRVRAVLTGGGSVQELPGALIAPGSDNKGAPLAAAAVAAGATLDLEVSATHSTITNGNIAAAVGADGLVTVSRVSDGKVVLKELARELLSGGGGPTPAPGPPAPPAPPVPTNTVTIALNNSLAHCKTPCCLDVANWKRDDNAAVLASDCHYDPHGFGGQGYDNQRWSIGADGTIKVALDGMCLTAASATSLTVSTCKAGEASQKWEAKPGVGPVKTGDGKCLTAGDHDGGSYSLTACDSNNKLQQFTIELAIAPPAPPPPPPPPPLTLLSFAAKPDDKIFGFGEHQQGHLDNKGLKYDMESCLVYGKSHGGEVCLPWILSASANANKKGAFSLEYGFLWNMPNYGGVEFGADWTNWTAQAGTQVDYFVTVGGKEGGTANASIGTQIMNSYVDAVGHSPMLPEWGSGYWHSKNRYSSQQQITDAAAGFASRGINVSVIVVDYNHWPRMGDFKFDPAQWPDVPAMMNNLTNHYNIDQVMVSTWPFIATGSDSFEEFGSKNLVFDTEGTSTPIFWDDNNCGDVGGPAKCYIYDPTQLAARKAYWKHIHSGYYQFGIKVFWLDASEPEISTSDAGKAALDFNNSLGTGAAVGMMYPYYHTQTIHDGLISEGEKDVVMLTRSAWAGMQRWGAALWSGDTSSHWPSLKVSIQAGLNTQLSGISWWTTDIGGYSGGDPSSPEFRELIVRW
eukprot:COSAG02_NODE_4503_length_5285_cov_5.431161_1_plen_738_part_00